MLTTKTFPINIRRDPSLYSLANSSDFLVEKLEIDSSHIFDGIFNGSKNNLIVNTESNFCVVSSEKKVLWKQPIENRFRFISLPIPENQKIIVFQNRSISIVYRLSKTPVE